MKRLTICVAFIFITLLFYSCPQPESTGDDDGDSGTEENIVDIVPSFGSVIASRFVIPGKMTDADVR